MQHSSLISKISRSRYSASIAALLLCTSAGAQQMIDDPQSRQDMRSEASNDWLDWRGNVAVGNWTGNRLLDHQRDLMLAQWQLDLSAKFNQAWSFKSNTNIAYMSALNSDLDRRPSEEKLHSSVRDAYLEWGGEQTEWRIGKQVFSWGRADRLNPTDQLSARDSRSPFATDEEQKLGSFAANLRQELNANTRLQLVVQAVKNGQGKVPSANLEDAFQLVQLDKKVDYAFKVDHSSSALDWSISYFDGVEKLRSLELMQRERHLLGLQRRYSPLRSIGMDAATTHGEWGFRGELAYLHFKSAYKADGGRISHWYGVAGIENNLAAVTNASISLQYFFRRFQDDPSKATFPDTWHSVTDNLQVANNQLHRWQDGYTLRFSQRLLNDQFDYELVAMVNARDKDYAFRPRLNYRFSDSTKWVFGCDLFRGRDHSFFGSLRKNSLAFTELVLIF